MKNLAYVTSLVMMDLDMYTDISKKKLCQYATGGYKWLGFQGDTRVKTCYMNPNDVYKGVLPDDVARVTKVGINVGGQWVTLTKDSNLFTKVPTDACGNDIFEDLFDTDYSQSSILERYPQGLWFAGGFRGGNYVGEFYGASGGFSSLGSFKVDEQNNIIQFDPRFPKLTYAVEYVSDGSDADGSTLIPSIAVEPIRAHIKYEIENNKRGRNWNPALIETLWGDRRVAAQDFKMQLYAPSIEEWCDFSYGQYQSSPKR